MATRLESAPLLATSADARVGAHALGAHATLSALGFFVTYAVIHTTHALHHDLPGLSRISSIPLFSCFTASVGGAGVTASFAGPLLRAKPHLTAHLPWLLTACVLLFSVLILFIP
jgi:hypothetical protein